MNVRIATKNDIEPLSKFVTEWVIYQLVCQGLKFNDEIFNKHLSVLIEAGNCMVVECDGKVVGGIGGRAVQSFYTQDIIFDVMTMYIDPEYRKFTNKIINALEIILSMTNVTKIVIANPAFSDSSKYNRFYRMHGYRLLQMSYVKNIKHKEV